MSTITRERIAELANFKPSGANSVNSATREEWQELARIALASLEAEPVGYFGRFDADDEDLIDQCSPNISGAFPLYAAPPAPVAVPTFDEWLGIRGNRPLGWVKDAMRESYDACRAAMLQGAEHVSNRDELPVEPKQEV